MSREMEEERGRHAINRPLPFAAMHVLLTMEACTKVLGDVKWRQHKPVER